MELTYTVKYTKCKVRVKQWRSFILISVVMVPFYLPLLAGCGARWPDCVVVINHFHSSVSLSSVKSSARSATVNTDASECFMAVVLWLKKHRKCQRIIKHYHWETKRSITIPYIKLTQCNQTTHEHACFFPCSPLLCCFQHCLHALLNSGFNQEPVHKSGSSEQTINE